MVAALGEATSGAVCTDAGSVSLVSTSTVLSSAAPRTGRGLRRIGGGVALAPAALLSSSSSVRRDREGTPMLDAAGLVVVDSVGVAALGTVADEVRATDAAELGSCEPERRNRLSTRLRVALLFEPDAGG